MDSVEPVPTPGPGTVGRPGVSRSVLYIEDNAASVTLMETLLSQRPEVTLMVAMHGGLGLEPETP